MKHEPPSRTRGLGLAMLSVALLLGGCSREYYRTQADQDVARLVAQKANDPRWPLEGYTIQPAPWSRLSDPTSPDFPPMPPDDPTSHRLMHHVDCKEGYPCWHRAGDLPSVDNLQWVSALPANEQGEIAVNQDLAVELALVNSRSFQQSLETLYESALDVSFERFRFDAQFFGGNSNFFTSDGRVRGGGRSSSTLQTDTDLQMRRMLASGGELVVGFANSFVWQFAGPDTETVNSLLNFSLMQPLLRGAGRARVLETLTLSERVLLANVRQMERFRRGFYLQVMIGRNPGPGPTRRGGFFGGSGLGGFTGVGGGGFGVVGGGAFGGGGGGGTGAAQASGFVGLLQDQKQIQFQEANVAGLRDALAQLEAAYDAGRIDLFQVNQNRTALFNTESQLLSLKTAYQNSLDQYKIGLGLPPEVNIVIRDPLLDRFDLIDPKLTTIQNKLVDLLNALRHLPADARYGNLQPLAADARQLRQAAAGHFKLVEQDHQQLLANVTQRRANLARLAKRPEIQAGDVDSKLYDVNEFNERVEAISRDLVSLARRFQQTLDRLDQTAAKIQGRPAGDPIAQPVREAITDQGLTLSRQLGELLLVQARTRLDTIKTVPVELNSERAWEIAEANRRDLMNSRAALVDQWRLVEFNANDLLSDLDFTFSGDLGTVGDNPVRFRNTTGRLRVGLEFDAPLTRLAERNTYRISLIEYQQARRRFMVTEDSISAGLRQTLRTIELNQLNLEIRRASVLIAIAQVEQAQLRLREPPKPGEALQLGATTARDLVDALRGLATAQNDFLNVWVNYDIQRLGLDFDLGTMQLDDRGVWIDPGPLNASNLGREKGPALPPTHEAWPLAEGEKPAESETSREGRGFNLEQGMSESREHTVQTAGFDPFEATTVTLDPAEKPADSKQPDQPPLNWRPVQRAIYKEASRAAQR